EGNSIGSLFAGFLVVRLPSQACDSHMPKGKSMRRTFGIRLRFAGCRALCCSSIVPYSDALAIEADYVPASPRSSEFAQESRDAHDSQVSFAIKRVQFFL